MKYLFYFIAAAFCSVSVIEFIMLCVHAYNLEFDLVAMGIAFTLFTAYASNVCFGFAKSTPNHKDK